MMMTTSRALFSLYSVMCVLGYTALLTYTDINNVFTDF